MEACIDGQSPGSLLAWLIVEKLEGTIAFDGLIQGRLPARSDAAAVLNEWVEFVRGVGIRFNLETRGGTFSLLPDDAPVSVQRLGAAPEETIVQMLEQFVSTFDDESQGSLTSTLRSSEFRRNLEVQSVYLIAGGAVRMQKRSLEAETVRPPEPLTPRQRLKFGLVGLGTVVVVGAVLFLIPGVRAMFGQVVDTVRPIDWKTVTVDIGPYGKWIKAEIDESKSSRAKLTLNLTALPTLPQTDEQWTTASQEPKLTFREKLALENLARGHLRVEVFDADGRFVRSGELRIAELLSGKSPQPAVILTSDQVRLVKYVFVP